MSEINGSLSFLLNESNFSVCCRIRRGRFRRWRFRNLSLFNSARHLFLRRRTLCCGFWKSRNKKGIRRSWLLRSSSASSRHLNRFLEVSARFFLGAQWFLNGFADSFRDKYGHNCRRYGQARERFGGRRPGWTAAGTQHSLGPGAVQKHRAAHSDGWIPSNLGVRHRRPLPPVQ